MNVRGVALIGPHPTVTGRGESFSVVGKQLVSGQLLLEEAVVRQIAIERTDHIVAVLVRQRSSRVGVEARGLGEPHHVEPHPAPSLAVMRAGQQPLDQLLVSLGRFIGQKLSRLFGSRRQPDQIELHATQQRQLVGRCREPRPVLQQRCDDERIDFVLRNRTACRRDDRHRLDQRHCGTHHRLEGPVIPFGLVELVRFGREAQRHDQQQHQRDASAEKPTQ